MIESLKRPFVELATLYGRLGAVARRGVWTLLAVELVLIAVVERDIQRRHPDGIRGPKLVWRVVATQNLIGPAAYLGLGRKRTQ